MNIEFHTPYKKVSETLVNDIRNELLEISHIKKSISRAEVMLREDDKIIAPENKICEIRLTVFGEDLRAHTRTDRFEASAKEAIRELKKMIMIQVKKQKEPAGQILSTVKV